jgi:PAS domain-containing protein
MRYISLKHFLRFSPWLSKLTGNFFSDSSRNDVDCIETLQYWRERILSAILLFGIIFAIIPYIHGMQLAFQEKAIGIAIVDTVVYGLAIGLFVTRKIKFKTRAALTISILYAVGLAVLIYRGPVTSGLIYLFSFSFFGGILLGLRAAILTLAINALTLCFIGWFISTDHVSWGVGMVTSPGRWLVTSLNFLFLAGAAAISTAVLVKGLQTSLLRERSTSRELAMEVAERKRAEEALKTNCVLLHIAEKTAKFGGWIVDITERKIKWSDGVAAIHEMPAGYSPLVNEAINFYAPEWRDKINCVFKDCVDKGTPFDEEMEIITAGEKRVWVRTIGQAVRDESGNIKNIQGALQDINDRKRSEMERERLQAQLNQAHKMESVGRLAGGVAHDFNNMLGVIIGYAEFALLKLNPNDPLHADIEEILNAAKRSADITRQLIAFARKQTIKPRALDLNKTVENIIKMLRRLIGENIDLAWLPQPELWPVRMDPAQIDQILTNLCVNSRVAIAGVGKISIETENIGILFLPYIFVCLFWRN